jgi:hypothetical protein
MLYLFILIAVKHHMFINNVTAILKYCEQLRNAHSIKPETLGYGAPPVLEGLAVLSGIIEFRFLRL